MSMLISKLITLVSSVYIHEVTDFVYDVYDEFHAPNDRHVAPVAQPNNNNNKFCSSCLDF